MASVAERPATVALRILGNAVDLAIVGRRETGRADDHVTSLRKAAELRTLV